MRVFAVVLAASAICGCGGSGGGSGFNGSAPVRLTVAVNGSGGGAVRESGGLFECRLATCAMDVPRGDHLHLTATPDVNARFDGWSGACAGIADCDVVADNDLRVSASFSTVSVVPPPGSHALTVSVTGPGAVHSTPAGIDCGTTCSAAFADGVTVMLSATPQGGARFAQWSGACTGTGACALKLTADLRVSASFEAVPPPPPAQCVGIVPQALGPASTATVPHQSGDVCFGATSDGAGFVAADVFGGLWSIFAPAGGSRTGAFAVNGHVSSADGILNADAMAPLGDGFAATQYYFPPDPPQEVDYSVFGHDGSESRTTIGLDICGPQGVFRVLAGGVVALVTCSGNGVEGWVGGLRFDRQHPAGVGGGNIGLRFPRPSVDSDIAAVGDAGAHLLMTVHPGSFAGLADADYAAVWFDPAGNAETKVFSAATGTGRTVLRALIGGGAAVQIGGKWTSVFRAGSASPDPVPPWLASHPNYDLEVIRGGRGYALIPRSGAADNKTLELFAADGTHCGSTTFPVGGLNVGLDGTVIASEGDGGCTHPWWPALLH
jgi:Divergent InlB B-repeat domain